MLNQIKKVENPNKALQVSLLCLSLILANTATLARTPEPKKATTNEVKEMVGNGFEGTCTGQMTNPSKLVLPIGKSTLVKLPEPLASRTVGNQGIVQAKMIAPQTLYLLGVDIGSTNMIIQGKSGICSIIDVTVTLDPDGLQQSLINLLPDEKNIQVTAVADSLILSGTVEDAITASRVVDIASAYLRRSATTVNISEGGAQSGGNQNSSQSSGGNQNQDTVNPRIVNMLSVSAQQQVMLEVKIAEVSKTLLDKLGIDLAIGKINGNSSFFYNILPGLLPGLVTPSLGTNPGGGVLNPRFAENINLGASTGSKDSFRSILVDAEKRDGLVKILAEPSIMAISGQEGSFLAGGTIFIPVSQNNNNGIPTVTLEEKEFGVGVRFTPTVLSGGRINLKVAPEVSELNREGVGITATGVSGTAILPSFTTRRASTTVQLLDGQSFAIGGLIKNNTTANIKAFPILGEIPIIGALFRSTDFQKDKTELIFVVTPHLVKPLASKEVVRLPTDRFVDPSRADIFLGGKLEGKLPPDAPPPVILEKKSDTLNPNAPAQASDTGFDMR